MNSEDLFPILRGAANEQPTVVWMAVALLSLLALAIVLEFVRQRAQSRRRLRREWEALEQIASDRELSGTEWNLLRGCIERRNPREPLRSATVRQEFDRCVGQEMAALLAQNDPNRYAEAGALLRDIRIRLGLDYIPYGQRICSTRELPTGQELWLATAEGERSQWHRATVVSVDEAYLHVVPAEDATLWGLRLNDRIHVRAWREEDARYAFTVSVARIEGKPPALFLYHTAEMARTQARAFFRIHYEETLSVGVLDPPAEDLDDGTPPAPRLPKARVRCRATSLSAGGIALVSPQPVPAQAHLRVPLELPGVDPIEADARIVGITQAGAGRYLVRATFVDMPEDTRDKLARFVALRQQVQGMDEEAE